jgi:GntR family transcriptional regulator
VEVRDELTPGQAKHRAVRDALVDLIRELPAGAGMPTERELSERFGVSRGTVRQALDRLEAEQRIHRHQGKGTFVAKPKMDHMLELTSHTEYIRARGMEPASRLISVTRIAAEAEVATALALGEGDEVLQIERVRLADGDPLAVEVLYLEAKRFDGVAAMLGESQSLYELLRARYGVELSWAEETIEAVVAPEREASLLGIAAGGPLLLLCRLSFDPIGRPVEFVHALYRADRFRFRTRLHLPATTATVALPPHTRLRLGTMSDAPGLAAVFVAAWRAGYPGIVDQPVLDALDEADIADWLRNLMSSNGPTTWLVESPEGDILAFSRHGEDPLDSRRGHIYSLYVSPAVGGRGIGKAMLDHDLRLLSERGLGTVTLWSFEGNQVARNLYASFGFAPDGARRVEPEYGAQEIRLRRVAVPGERPGTA